MLKVLKGRQDSWPDALDGTLFAYRTSKHCSTGFTPFYLMYGRQATLPVDCKESNHMLQSYFK